MLHAAELAADADSVLSIFSSGFDADGTTETMRLGPFVVGPDGLLRPASETVAPRFSVRWRGYTVHAWIRSAAETGSRAPALSLEVVTGRVPSTVSCHGTDRRERTFRLLRTLAGKLPRDWRLHLLPDHHFGVSSEFPLVLPTSAAEMLTGLTSFLVCLAPYLGVMDEAGMGFGADAAPGGGVGSAKT